MVKSKIKSADRILAVLLTVLMVATMIPISMLQTFAATANHPDKLTVTVTDGTAAVEGASVTITVTGEVAFSYEGITDADGVAAFDTAEIDSLMDGADVSFVTAAVSVEKDGFVKNESEIEIKAENLAENYDITLEKVKTTAIVSVALTGSAKVELNGVEQNTVTVDIGAEVTVKITPAANSYIKSLTVAGEAASVEKYAAYEETVKADDDISIAATVVKEATVTVDRNDGGVVEFDGNAADSYTVDAGKTVQITVKANEGYVISSINVGGGNCSDVLGRTEFTIPTGVERNITVTARFVKLHTVTVTHTENGTAVTSPEGTGGVVEVIDGNKVTITATPEENFRVSEVTINGEKDTDVTGDNDSAYEKELTPKEDCTIVITFAPNIFNVTASPAENGSVSIGADIVEYDKSSEIEVIPNDGYSVTSVKVNGTDITDYTTENGTVKFTIDNITEDKNIVAAFAETAKCDVDYKTLFNTDDAVRNPGMTYIYKKNAEVTFSTDKEGIILYDAADNVIGGGSDVKSVTLDKTTEIAKIALYYKAEGEMAVMPHFLTSIPAAELLRIVVDKTAPTFEITPDKANENGYYNSDVKISVSAEDSGDYSGIAKIEYRIDCPDAMSSDWVKVYDYNPEEGILAKVKDKTFTVIAKENNSDDVKVYVRVTDRAGNVVVSDATPLKINCTPPSFTVSFNKTGATENIYDDTRTATIKYADRSTTFDENKVLEGIAITATDAAGNDVEVNRVTMITIDKASQTATIVFDKDANYTLDINYTNKAGLAAKSATGIAFTVDKTAPEATISLLGNSWNTILDTLTFGLYSNNEITAKVDATDATTSVAEILYFLSEGDKAYSQTELETLYEDGKFTSEIASVTSGKRFVIYARIADKAGNAVYVGTDGAVYDTTEANIELVPDTANGFGLYNDDVKVQIAVNEPENGSGIKKIKYTVTCDGKETQSATLYSFDYVRESSEKNNPNGGTLAITDWNSQKQKNTLSAISDGQLPGIKDLKMNWAGYIIVVAKENNSDNVVVTVEVEDNAGNINSESVKLAINIDKPVIAVTFDNNPANKVVDGIGYFGAETRQAKITITDRATAFSEKIATKGIWVKAYNSKNEEITPNYEISFWGHNGNEHTATITFYEDARYEWGISYTNLAGNANESVITGASVAPFNFVVDKSNPYGTVTVEKYTWDTLLNVLTFGLYSGKTVEVTATKGDDTSPVIVEYFMTDNTVIKSSEELDKEEFKPYSAFSVEPNDQFVVYLKITDYAGNYVYICSDGYIVDIKSSTISLNAYEDEKMEVPEDDDNVFNIKHTPVVNIIVDEVVKEEDKDAEPYSGINKIEYKVLKNDNEVTQEGTLYHFDYKRDGSEDNKVDTNGGTLTITDWNSEEQKNTKTDEMSGAYPSQEELRSSWNGYIVIDKEANNCSQVVVYVKVTDNAGNTSCESITVDIDIVAPTIDITFDNNADNNGNAYFKDNDNNPDTAVRTATVVITERTKHFNAPVVYLNGEAAAEDKALNNIIITATDAEGNEVEDAYEISDWTTVESLDDPDAATHTATLTFKEDANYTWSINFEDTAGNKCEDIDTKDSVAPYNFTIDTAKPEGTVKAVSTEERETEWDALRDKLTFGFWSKEEIVVTGTASDITSAPIASVEYYKVKAKSATDGVEALTKEDLDKITDWKKCTVKTDENGLNAEFDVLKVEKDEQFVVYLKITDLAGNYDYIGTNGLIVDHTAPIEETIAPEITIDPVQPVNGIYNGNVNVDIKVTDPLTGGTYSGLKTVKYRILNMGKETESGVLYSFDNNDPEQADLLQTWTGEITVSENNNSNDVVIEVYAEDNSLNSSDDRVSIKIDTTKPEINVSYDNNNADSGKYFNNDRIATVVISERNFDEKDVKFTFENTDGIMPMVGTWTKTEGTGNLDDTKWTTTVSYTADGDYTFDVEYTDLAGNKADEADYGNSVAPVEFTIDKTLPVVSVSYDNNKAANGKYFDAERTATIVVNEHNFDLERVEFTQTASIDGRAIEIPEAAWTHDGDVHTAVIEYKAEGDYTFDVSVTDMAGNVSEEADYGESVAGKDFVLDYTIAKPVITGVENGCAYKEDVIPTVSFEDINYDTYTVRLTRTRLSEIGRDVTAEFIGTIATNERGGSGSFDTFEKIVENDGIYTIEATVTDKAGNTEKTVVTFSVNRFGSVYEYDEYLVSLIKDGGQYITITEEGKAAVKKDLIIREYNADKLIDDSIKILITRDGKTINAEYDANPSVSGAAIIGEKGWYQYEYKIAASNFAEDGVYKITLTSQYATVDSEVNDSASVPENSVDTEGNAIVDTMTFTVDTVAPEIRNVVNLEKAIINGTKVEVKYTIVDVGGLKSIRILVDGNEVANIEDFADSIFNYSGVFEILEKSDKQSVRIIVTDLAGNVTDTDSEEFDPGELYEFNKEVTVSTNFFVRWYANKIVFWGSIAGTIALAAAICFMIIAIKRKKESVK